MIIFNLVSDARIVLGGVAPTPYRAITAEEAINEEAARYVDWNER